MIDIGCDRCGKRYRIDETRMKGETARVKCKSCGNPITVTKPQDVQPAESIFAEPPPAAPEPGPQPGAARPRAAAAASKPKEPEALPDADTAAEPLYAAEKPRFGLFGKTLIVMLLVSVLPFGMFWFLTFRETSERIRGDSELLLAQTGKGIADQMDGREDECREQHRPARVETAQQRAEQGYGFQSHLLYYTQCGLDTSTPLLPGRRIIPCRTPSAERV